MAGANGFVGQALAGRLTELGLSAQTVLIDREPFDIPGFACVHRELGDAPGSLDLLAKVEIVCHLAALPGAAAERDPVLSRKVDCDLAFGLIERLAHKRLVVAGSIAVYGSDLGDLVDDGTRARPDSVYGTHKRIVEFAFADAVRRGAVEGAVLRLPGIVGRKPPVARFGSAFLSDVFHAIRKGRRYAMPVSPEATSWISSARACARQLAHSMLGGLTLAEPLLPPATHIRKDELVAEIGGHGDASGITYAEKPHLRRAFGSHPPQLAARALELGFEPAKSVPELVEAAL